MLALFTERHGAEQQRQCGIIIILLNALLVSLCLAHYVLGEQTDVIGVGVWLAEDNIQFKTTFR